jgi:hypothetical protein
MASKIVIKRSVTAAAPAGLSYGEMAFIQGSGLTANQFYVGISGGNPVWVGAQIGTTGTWTDNSAQTSLATQYATDQRRISSSVSSFNGLTGAVSGVTTSVANTFTQLNTFSAGISASDATFTGSISGATATFSKDITVNYMTVGLGGSSQISNVAVGYLALALNTGDIDNEEGIGNVAIGGSALNTNTTGAYNTAIGYGALSSNSSGANNIGIGQYALTNSSTASNSIAIGALALAYGSLGSFNIGVGFETLSAAGNTGNSNVAVGYQSLKTNTTGTNNVGMGYRSLYLDTTGLDNTGIGTSALQQNTTGSNNTGVGSSALRQLTTASQMTALGNNAGRFRGTGTDTNTTGTGGIYIGYQARGSTLAQTNEIVIGVNALGLGSNTAVIGATLQSAATIYGLLNLPSGLSASGATLSGTVITSEKVNAITSARTVTVNFQNGNIQTLTGLGSGATGSSAIGFTGASATGSSTVTMIITNGGLMTSNTTFWSTAVKWPGGFKTTLSTSGVDILTFKTIDAGTTIYGMLGGKAFS